MIGPELLWALLSITMLLGLASAATFVILASRVDADTAKGGRVFPRFAGMWLILWPPGLLDWLATVIDRSKGSSRHQAELGLARVCRLLTVGYYLLAAFAFLNQAL